jgi:hypothetical protein
MKQVTLSSEVDSELWEKLCAVVELLGGSIHELHWAMGGSQEIIKYRIDLPSGSLEATSETYVGLSLQGPDDLVSMLAALAKEM